MKRPPPDTATVEKIVAMYTVDKIGIGTIAIKLRITGSSIIKVLDDRNLKRSKKESYKIRKEWFDSRCKR